MHSSFPMHGDLFQIEEEPHGVPESRLEAESENARRTISFKLNDELFQINEEPYEMPEPRRGSLTPLEKEEMELKDVSLERIMEANMMDLSRWSSVPHIQNDPLLQDLEDIRKRLILYKRKLEGCSHRWKHFFTSVLVEANSKGDALIDLMKPVEETFKKIPTDSLSEILRKEGHLSQLNLLEELSIRIKTLQERKSLIIIAGETNGGKSSFLNLLLGEEILPTDVLHCTFAICKIVYSKDYRVETLNNNGEVETFPCTSREEAAVILKKTVSQEDMRMRMKGSDIKEITLSLPADILKSGVTLVDTPGIGEDDQMDDVTMNYVRSTHAAAFIYIIKSDTAGGVQEDRLISFLQAIKNRYQSSTMVESFDPRAAMFVCHRWDNIEESQQEKVKKNALDQLAYVWPGFQPSQTFFFSTKDASKHFSVDPEYVTDEFFTLLQGLKNLFDRARHNAIKHQYVWMKHIVPQASRHLKTMITHCIRNNEELERYFRSVAQKQEKLNLASKENSKQLEAELLLKCNELREKVQNYLNLDSADPKEEIPEFNDLVAECSQEKFLVSRDNRHRLNEKIVRCLLKLVDTIIQTTEDVHKIDTEMLYAIQSHLGLFSSQVKQIKKELLHGQLVSTPHGSSANLVDCDTLGSSSGSFGNSSADTSFEEFQGENNIDPDELSHTVNGLLSKFKHGKVRQRHKHHTGPEERQSLFGKLKDKVVYQVGKIDPETYVEDRIKKIARKMCQDDEILGNIVNGYTEWIRQCVSYASGSIPSFVEVNTKLMDEIREHRESFEEDKHLLKTVMEELEPSRNHLRGYGSLYMADINADLLAFNVDRRHSSVFTFPDNIQISARPNDDSGFQGSGSKKRKVRRIANCLWARIQGANIEIDNVAERVVVKTYIYDMDDKLMLSEIASLRCLEYTNIAPFCGMTRILAGSNTGNYDPEVDCPDESPQKFSAFIFRGDLVSARVHSKRKMTNLQEFVPELIKSLLDGLNYIHREKLVHMELNMDTVMVDRTGQVKLCQMCKPREARFPAKLEVRTKSCVCLSPSVLQGNIYESTDDLYAFGLLLWELLFPLTPPYLRQREWPLKEFIDKCHPFSMLQEDLNMLQASEEVKEVLKGTLLVKRGTLSMPATDIQSYLENINEDPAVKRLTANRGSFPAISVTDTSVTENHSYDKNLKKSARSSSQSPTPSRPPRTKHESRKKHMEKSLSLVVDPSSSSMSSLFPGDNPRRGSLPPNLNDYQKPKKKNFLKSLFPLLSRHKHKEHSASQNSLDHSKYSEPSAADDSDSWLLQNPRTATSKIADARKDKRNSLPTDCHLHVPRSRDTRTDNIDVPKELENFFAHSSRGNSPKLQRPRSLAQTYSGSMPCLAMANGAFGQERMHSKRDRSSSPKNYVRFDDQRSTYRKENEQLSQSLPRRPDSQRMDFDSYPNYSIGTIKESNSNSSLSSSEDLSGGSKRYSHGRAKLEERKKTDLQCDAVRRESAPSSLKHTVEIKRRSVSPPSLFCQKNLKHPISPLAVHEGVSYLDTNRTVSPSSPRLFTDSGNSSLDISSSSSKKSSIKPIFYQSNPSSPELHSEASDDVFFQSRNSSVSYSEKDYVDASEPQTTYSHSETHKRESSQNEPLSDNFKDSSSFQINMCTSGLNHNYLRNDASGTKSDSQEDTQHGSSSMEIDQEVNEEAEAVVHDYLANLDDFGTAVGNNTVPLPPPIDFSEYNFD